MGPTLSTKAFTISLIIISLVGIGFIGGLYYILNRDTLINSFQYVPISIKPSSFNLTVNPPDDNLLIFEGNVRVSGKSGKFASIIVTDGAKTYAFEANSNGDFLEIIPLEEGPHNLVISAFDGQGNTKSVTKQIYFSKEKLDDK